MAYGNADARVSTSYRNLEGSRRHAPPVLRQPLGNANTRYRVILLDGVYHVHAGGYLAKYGVDPVKVRLGGVRNEELAAAGVLSGVGH